MVKIFIGAALVLIIGALVTTVLLRDWETMPDHSSRQPTRLETGVSSEFGATLGLLTEPSEPTKVAPQSSVGQVAGGDEAPSERINTGPPRDPNSVAPYLEPDVTPVNMGEDRDADAVVFVEAQELAEVINTGASMNAGDEDFSRAKRSEPPRNFGKPLDVNAAFSQEDEGQPPINTGLDVSVEEDLY